MDHDDFENFSTKTLKHLMKNTQHVSVMTSPSSCRRKKIVLVQKRIARKGENLSLIPFFTVKKNTSASQFHGQLTSPHRSKKVFEESVKDL